METPYDWVTLAIFAGLVVLYLQRSISDERSDSIIPYLGCSIGCAVGNQLGNKGYDLAAIAVIVMVLAVIFVVLKPLGSIQRG